MKLQNEFELDARGLNCPMPVIRVRKMLQRMYPGQILQVRTTDPGSFKDMKSYCNQTGDELLESREVEKEFHYIIRKKPQR